MQNIYFSTVQAGPLLEENCSMTAHAQRIIELLNGKYKIVFTTLLGLL